MEEGCHDRTPNSRSLPANPSLEWLRKEAKAQLKLLRQSGDAVLSDAQFQIAQSYGFTSWRMLKEEVERREGGETSLIRALRAVRLVLPSPSRAKDAVELEQVFYKCLSVGIVILQAMGLWACFTFLANLDGPAPRRHPVAQAQPVTWVAIPARNKP